MRNKMYRKKSVLLLIICFLQGYDLTRDDIIAQYEPTLTEITANFTTQYSAASSETVHLQTQILASTNNTVAQISSQLDYLNNSITVAKNMCPNNINALNCLNYQDTSAQALTPSSVNATCWNEETFTDLGYAKMFFKTIAEVSNDAIKACDRFFPLDDQDDEFETCLSDRVLEFTSQFDPLVMNFEERKEAILDVSLQCLGDQTASFGLQVNEIIYQVTVCLTVFPCDVL